MEIDAANVSLRGGQELSDVVISYDNVITSKRSLRSNLIQNKKLSSLTKGGDFAPFAKGGLKGDLAGFAANVNPPALRATSLTKGGFVAPFVKGGLKGDLAGFTADNTSSFAKTEKFIQYLKYLRA